MNQNSKKFLLVGIVALGMSLTAAHAATVAYWDFDSGINGPPSAGQAFSDNPVADLSGNGNTMFGYDTTWGPSYSSAGDSLDNTTRSSVHTGSQDGYTAGAPVNAWSPEQWTIEVSVKLNSLGGWRTVIGKDGTAHAQPESDFYLQNNGIDDRWRLDFNTVSDEKIVIDSDFVPVAGQWYGLAAVSDGFNVTLYADKLGGLGWENVGTAVMTGGTAAANALSNGGINNWTFGRGWYNGGFGDHIDGNLDNIRFSDVALAPQDFLIIPEPTTLALGGFGLLGLWMMGRRRR